MTRTLKLMTLGALSAWLLTSTGCEDKVCLQQLQTCKKESSDQHKECASNLSKIEQLKTQLTEAQTKVDSLTKENDELKQSAEAAAKSKGKAKKGKHKRKHRK
jgi:outer membrane murein-binding lipoprotein Lpp